MAAILIWSTDRWYYIDDWDFLLTRSLDDFGSLLDPHSGHLQLPVAVVYQIIHEQLGFDYWPWFVVPRVVGYGAMTYVMWVVLRRRGADPIVSWIALGGLLILGSSAFLNIATIGHHLVFPALALAASMYVAGGPRWTWGDQVTFAVLALVMVVSTSTGIAGVAALGIVGVCLGRFRTVAPPFVPAAVAYLTWLIANPGGGTSSLGLKGLLAVPGTMWDMVAPTVARTLSLPSSLGPALALLVAGLLLVWTVRDRLGPFEAVWLLTAVIWMTMTIVSRVVPGPISPAAARYGYMITWLLVPAIVPHVRLSRSVVVRWVAIGAAVLVVSGNAVQLKTGLDWWASETSEVRGRIQAIAILAAAGEPAVETSSLFADRAPGLRSMTVGWVRRVSQSEGWVPDLAAAGLYEQVARGVMRMAIEPGPAGHACQQVEVGESLGVRTTEYPTIGLGVGTRTDVDISYVDRYGSGERSVELAEDHILSYPEGASALVVFRVTDGAPLQICRARRSLSEVDGRMRGSGDSTATGDLTAPSRLAPLSSTERFFWPAPTPSRRDLLIAAGGTVVSMVVTMLGSTNGWFFGDAWDFLVNRDLADLTTLAKPHAGHLQFPVALVYQFIYERVGLDYWPWFLLPRVFGIRCDGLRALAGDAETRRRPDSRLDHPGRAAVLRVVDLPDRRHDRTPPRGPSGRPCRRHVRRRWATMDLERSAGLRRPHPRIGGQHQLGRRRRGGTGDRRPVPRPVLAGRPRVRPRCRRLPGLAGDRRGHRCNVDLDRPRLPARRTHQPLGDDGAGAGSNARLPRGVRAGPRRGARRRAAACGPSGEGSGLSRQCGL